jgi:hypothetical protein
VALDELESGVLYAVMIYLGGATIELLRGVFYAIRAEAI